MKQEKKDLKPPQISEAATHALQQFANGLQLMDRAKAITSLLAHKALAHVVRTDAFQSGLTVLLAGLKPDINPEYRLAALAQLSRIAQSAKPIASDIRKRVIPSLESVLPPVSLLKEADDRGYVAKACGWASSSWVVDYAVQAIAEEETAEKVRGEFVAIVFSRAASLAEVFTRLGDAFSQIRPATESPSDSVAKRLTRTLSSLRGALVTSLAPPGDNVGEALAELVRKPFVSIGTPKDERACIALATEAVLCVHEIVRTRFSVATDADTYTAIKRAKKLFPGSAWPTELRKPLELVANSILEAILLLAKRGISAQPLVEQLELVSGYRERADTLLKELADKHPELSEGVRAWLRKTRVSQTGADRTAIIESQELRVDPSVGQALLECRRVEEAREALTSNIIPALKLYDPSQVPAMESFVARTDALSDAVEEVAKRRQLGILGAIGDEIDFSPKYFESVKGIAGQRARIVRPAIVRLIEDGTPGEVVTKGLVE